jgi:hypothetical protein
MQDSIRAPELRQPGSKNRVMDMGTEDLSHLQNRGHACPQASQAPQIHA